MKVSLKALRVNANLNQKEVAAMMNISPNTLMNWESNYTSPDVLQLSKLCTIYKCTIDDIFLPDKLAKSQHHSKGGRVDDMDSCNNSSDLCSGLGV